MKRPQKIVVVVIIVILASLIIFGYSKRKISTPTVSKTTAVVPVTVTATHAVTAPKPAATSTGTMYHTIVLATASPAKELAALVGGDNVQTVLEINRIDSDNIKKGSTLIIPNSIADVATYSPFPVTIVAAADIPKLMVVSLQMQAFGIYESGQLVRWGAVNTGKQSTPTPSKLYFANWKGKSVISSEDDTWVLPWYVNLDNKRGISMHQYALPGYPASHACVRMFEQDAEWVYNWIDQWNVSGDGQTILRHGTPVIVFGEYAYGKTAPWKKLTTNAAATTISSDELEAIVSADKAAIVAGV